MKHNNKKILFLSHQADFIYGGEICTLAFMRELKERGVEVHFASPPGIYQDRAKEFAICHEISSCQFSRHVHLLPRLLPALVKTHKELRKIIKENNIDVLHATSLKAMVYCWRLSKKYSVIWHHHDILPLRFRNNIWIRTLAMNSKKILTPSEATRQALLDAGVDERSVEVLHNGFRLQDWKARSIRVKNHPLVVGVIGEISERKGHDFLIGVIDHLIKCEIEPSDIQFRIIGEGLSDKNFSEQIKLKLNATGWVHFLGRREDVKEQLQSIDLILVPSRQDPLPTVIVEAYYSGVPAIGRSVGGIPEMIQDGENGFLADTSQEMAEKIIACMDRKLWENLSKNAREFAEKKFSIDRLTDQLLEIYNKVHNAG